VKKNFWMDKATYFTNQSNLIINNYLAIRVQEEFIKRIARKSIIIAQSNGIILI
jgi:hypothetical protein